MRRAKRTSDGLRRYPVGSGRLYGRNEAFQLLVPVLHDDDRRDTPAVVDPDLTQGSQSERHTGGYEDCGLISIEH